MNTDSQWYEVTVTHRFNPARTFIRRVKTKDAASAEEHVRINDLSEDSEPSNNWDIKSEECRWMPKPK